MCQLVAKPNVVDFVKTTIHFKVKFLSMVVEFNGGGFVFPECLSKCHRRSLITARYRFD